MYQSESERKSSVPWDGKDGRRLTKEKTDPKKRRGSGDGLSRAHEEIR